jgi:hypothetical protein
MDTLVDGFVAMSAGLIVVALLSVPTWLFASMNRGTLWRIRDCIFDARRTGALPDCDAVSELLDRAERFIIVVPNITAAQIWYVRRRVAPGFAEGGWRSPELPEGTDQRAVRIFRLLEAELQRSIIRQQLLCSWSGLLLVAPRNLGLVRWVIRKRPFDLHELCTKPIERRAKPKPSTSISGKKADDSMEVVRIAEQIVAEYYRTSQGSLEPDLTHAPA